MDVLIDDHECVLGLTGQTAMPVIDYRRCPHLSDPNNEAYTRDDELALRETGIGAGMHVAYRLR